MPRHAKSTKFERDRKMVEGLKKHASEIDIRDWEGPLKTPEAIAARFQAHLDAMKEVADREVAWRVALDREEKLEAEIKDLANRVRLYLLATYGERSFTVLDFGIEPLKKTRLSAEKMLRTVEKRNATRKARGTMGKKQRLR